jgi:small neutral amino acid transporter SnatA (MarC family)
MSFSWSIRSLCVLVLRSRVLNPLFLKITSEFDIASRLLLFLDQSIFVFILLSLAAISQAAILESGTWLPLHCSRYDMATSFLLSEN